MRMKDFGRFYHLRSLSPGEWAGLLYDSGKSLENQGFCQDEQGEDTCHFMRKLYIEPTSECNLACEKCFRQSWFDEGEGRMEPAVLQRVLEDREAMHTVGTITFGGMGEPLCHPDLADMVRMCGDRRAEVITNGILLTPEMSRALLAAGLNKLWISFDGFEDKEVCHNLTVFNQLRRGSPAICALGISFVATPANLDRLHLLPDFCARVNATDVNVSNALPIRPVSPEDSLFLRLLYTDFAGRQAPGTPRYRLPLMDFTREDTRSAYTFLLEQEGRVEILGKPVRRNAGRCDFVRQGQVFLRWDGDVCPCMGLLHNTRTYLGEEPIVMHRHSFGNVGERRLSEIWRSGEYERFRERVKDFVFPPCLTCGGCEQRRDNTSDCCGNERPVCGVCFWAEGFFQCP